MKSVMWCLKKGGMKTYFVKSRLDDRTRPLLQSVGFCFFSSSGRMFLLLPTCLVICAVKHEIVVTDGVCKVDRINRLALGVSGVHGRVRDELLENIRYKIAVSRIK